MGSFLKYRFPNEEIVTKTGEFEICDNDQSISGFILSDFEGKKIYRFKEGDLEGNFHFLKDLPSVVSKQEYLSLAANFLKEIRAKNIGKAVFSRIKKVDFDHSKALHLFNDLERKYPQTLVYLVSSEKFGTWVGASPEILIESSSTRILTMALAGTLPANDHEQWSNKERDEQQQVTDFILDILHSFEVTNSICDGPKEVVAGPVKHLRTDIRFDMRSDKILLLARQLHPTPAVSGMPRKEAIELIRKFEEHDRSLYAGMVGFVGENLTKLFVNLRCCSIHENEAYLYLGGGFTRDSEVEKEWEETENKSRTLLNIIEKL